MNDWEHAEQRVERAHELYERGHWEEALHELKEAIAINPYNGSWHFNLGLTYDAMDRYEDAIPAYRSALEMDPEDVEILCALGIASNRVGHFDEAIGFLNRIEAIDASFEPAYCNRIVSYSEKGNHEKAEEMFFLARQYRDKCPICLYNMGGSLFARGLFDRALWCWQEVLMADPDHPQVHARIADAHWAKGQLQEARGHFIEELRSNPGDIDVMLDLGELLMEMGELTLAGEKFRQVLELSPDECTALFQLGSIALHESGAAGTAAAARQGAKLTEALELFRRALRADRTFAGAHLRMAQIYHRQNRLSEAAFHGNCELAQRANDEQILLELGNLFMDLGQLVPAETTFQRVLAANPKSAAARHNLGVALLLAGRVEEGIDQERRALRIQPKYMLAMHNLALAYLSKRDFVRAGLWLREAMDIAPDDPQLRQLRGKLRLTVLMERIKQWPRGWFRGKR